MRPLIFGLAFVALAGQMPGRALAEEDSNYAAAKQITEYIRRSGKLQNYSLGVKYSNGTVWLKGQVESKQQMAAAIELVNEFDGIDKIVNNLKIGAPAANRANAKAPRGNIQLTGAQQACPPDSMGPSGAPPGGYRPLPGAGGVGGVGGANRPLPAYVPGPGNTPPPAAYDQPTMPNVAWPSYAAYPNYAAVTYPKQYSATAWPFIGPFYPYPQVPLGWRKVSLEWDDGWWFLDFDDRACY